MNHFPVELSAKTLVDSEIVAVVKPVEGPQLSTLLALTTSAFILQGVSAD